MFAVVAGLHLADLGPQPHCFVGYFGSAQRLPALHRSAVDFDCFEQMLTNSGAPGLWFVLHCSSSFGY